MANTGAAETLAYALAALVTLGSVGGGILMFARRLERRERFAQRACAVAVVGALLAIGGIQVAPTFSEISGASYLLQFGLFSAMLAILVGVVVWLYDMTPWAALFCCTAG